MVGLMDAREKGTSLRTIREEKICLLTLEISLHKWEKQRDVALLE